MATYDIIEADGQRYTLSSNETWENKLIDLSTGESFTIYARNRQNWTLRNIGFRGYSEGGEVHLELSDTGGSSLVENVYLGDGAARTSDRYEQGPAAIYVGGEHSGDITFRNCNVQGFPNHGIYANNGTGTVTIDNCYAKNNGVASYRVGAGDTITDSVAFNDSEAYGWDDLENTYAEEDGRPVWAWGDGTTTITSSHFAGAAYPHDLVARDGATIDFNTGTYDGRAGGRGTVSVDAGVTQPAETTLPDGVPQSAELAAGEGPTSTTPIDLALDTVETDADYEVIEANHQTIHIDDNEIFQNKLIDCRNGNGVRINAHGSTNWEIRNIGFRGQIDDLRTSSIIHASEVEGGESTIENVYLPGVTATNLGQGISIAADHAGTINIRRAHVAGFGLGGLNASQYGRGTGGGGNVHVRNSFFYSNNFANVMLSGDGDSIADSTVLVNTAGRPKTGYGIFAFPDGPIVVDNVILAMNGNNYSIATGWNNQGVNVTVTDTDYDTTYFGGLLERYGSDIELGAGNTREPFAAPSERVGVPTSPEDAAGGAPVVTDDPPPEPPTEPSQLEFPGAIGYVSTEFESGLMPLPVYPEEEVEWPCMAVQVGEDDDDVGAFAIAPRGEAAFPGRSIHTAGGVFAPTHLGSPRPDPGGGDPKDPGGDPPDADGALAIDNFDTGISSSWTNHFDWETSANAAFRGARSARRIEGGLMLGAGPEHFGEWIRRGGPFFRMAVRSHTSANPAMTAIEFARSRDARASNKYGLQIDFHNSFMRINTVTADGSPTTITATSPGQGGLQTNAWYDVIGHWAADDTIRFWLYTRDGTEMAMLTANGDGRSGDYWALGTTRPTNMYLDEMAFYETHPHTGEVSGATIGGGTFTPPQDLVVDDFAHNTPETYYDGALPNYETTTDPTYEGDRSLRLKTDRHGGGELRSMPGDGLPYYPEEGDTIKWRFRSNRSSTTANDTLRHRFRFGWADDDDHFDAWLDISRRQYGLSEKTSGIDRTPYAGPKTTAHIPTSRWIRGELEWHENRHRVRFIDDITEEVLAPWLEGEPAHHDAEDGGFAIVHNAYAATDELWTDFITLDPRGESS